MEQHELLDVGISRESDSVFVGTVPPAGLGSAANFPRILFGQVHRVVDQQISILAQVCQLGIDDVVVLCVRAVDYGMLLVVDAVCVDAVGVISTGVLDADGVLALADGDGLAFCEIVKVHSCGEVGEADGEAWVLHLPCEGSLEGVVHVDAAVQVERVAWKEGGGEERKSVDVVPVHVAEEDVSFDGHLAEQVQTQQAKPRTPIQHNQNVAAPHLDAARVSSHIQGVRTRDWYASANAPELDAHPGHLLQPSANA